MRATIPASSTDPDAVKSVPTSPETVWAYDGRRYRQHRFAPEIERQIKELNRLDNWHGLLGWARDVALVVAMVLLCTRVSWWFYPVALVVIGSRQRAFSNLLHESAHGILAANRRLNLLLGTVLTAYPIFQLHYAYKRSHVAQHHPHLGDPQRDPDLRFMIGRGVYDGHDEGRLRWRLLIAPALGASTLFYLRYLVETRLRRGRGEGQAPNPAQRREPLFLAGFWALVIAAGIATGAWPLIILFWLVPFLTTYQVLGWYIELAEHTPLVRDSNISIYMTRNRLSRGIELFLTGTYADHLHLEHHLDPRTPYWNLRRARLIRLSDPDYAAVDRWFGGLFRAGPNGQPSALKTIIHGLTTPPVVRKAKE